MLGWISSIWRKRCGSHAEISSGIGSRFPGGRHLSTFAMKTSERSRPMPARSLSSELAGLADERDSLLVLVEAGRLADEHQVCVRVTGAEDDLRATACEHAPRAAGRLVRVGPER